MSPLLRRLGAFGLTVCVLEAVERIPLGGVDQQMLASMGAPGFTIGWLGVTPWISAFLLVEVLARVVPAWQPLRYNGRDRLFRWVVGVWLLGAVLQALSLAASLEQMQVGYAPLVLQPGWGFRLTTAATLVAASALVGVISFWNHRHGLGAGLALAWASAWLLEPLDWWHAVQLGEVVLLVPALIVASAVGMATLRTPKGLRPAPAGLVPLMWVPGLVTTWVSFNPDFATYSTEATLAGVVLGTVLLATLENPGLLQRQRQDFSLAIVVNAAWGGLLAWLVLERSAPTWGVGLVVLTTLALDLVAELRARLDGLDHEVRRFHHLRAADEAVQRLEDAGIPAALRGDRVRALLHFFGPHLPIGLLVAEGDQQEAEEALSL